MKAIVVSLNFNPGHTSHLVASYKQCKELGYDVSYYVNYHFCNYLPNDSSILIEKDAIPKVDLAIFLFPSIKNIIHIQHLKRHGSKVVYVFHEPLAPMLEYRNAGFSLSYLAKLWMINRISALTVRWSDVILLPSQKAMDFYMRNPLYRNKNYHYLPLMYDDECLLSHMCMPRIYFSYIGTVAADHSFNEFLNFVTWAINNRRLMWLKFLIATKSDLDLPQNIINSDRVVVYKGRAMTNEEINGHYASTLVVWNAYVRTTQSGVLAKSFMFGTPAIILQKNSNEFAQDGKEVLGITNNCDFEEIEHAINRITEDFQGFSQRCRNRFMTSFFYREYNERFRALIEQS